jgi:hypothetical protein
MEPVVSFSVVHEQKSSGIINLCFYCITCKFRTCESHHTNKYAASNVSCSPERTPGEENPLSLTDYCTRCHLVQSADMADNKDHSHHFHALHGVCGDTTVLDTSIPQVCKCSGKNCSHCQHHQEFHQAPSQDPRHRVRRHSSLGEVQSHAQPLTQSQDADTTQESLSQ